MLAQTSLLAVIDTASDDAGVALLEDGSALGSSTWRTRMNHSRELLPTLDWLLERHGRDKGQIRAIGVCLGPGGYAGLRVGLSTAKAMAYGLDARLVGVGRLAAEALPLALSTQGRVVPVQVAGRAELAFGVYYASDGELVELVESRLGSIERFAATLTPGDVVCGEADRLDEASREAISLAGARIVMAPQTRVLAVGALAWQRLQRGEQDDIDSLAPMYLRAPAIGPQPPR